MIRTFRRFARLLVLGAALASSAALAADEDKIIYPGKSSSVDGATHAAAGGVGTFTIVGAIALAAAGGWLLWSKRTIALAGRDTRLLNIAETRPLGNRQYLVVASYEGKKFLLGVCPGRIDMLAPLDGSPSREKAS